MFGRKPKTETQLDIAIDAVLSELITYEPDNEEFAKQLAQLEKLSQLKSKDEKRVSPDQKALIIGNIIGILIIVGYEHAHVVTTKALGFTLKK